MITNGNTSINIFQINNFNGASPAAGCQAAWLGGASPGFSSTPGDSACLSAELNATSVAARVRWPGLTHSNWPTEAAKMPGCYTRRS
jgi:hypothetical protein